MEVGMGKLSEVDAIKVVDEALVSIDDKEAQKRILRWAYEKYCSGTTLPGNGLEQNVNDGLSLNKDSLKKKKNKSNKPGKSKKISYSIDKSLNLKPTGKTSFSDFASQKSPITDREKVVVCVYYLQNKIGEKPIDINHVYTCYKSINWRLPSDLVSVLRWVASQKGWLDTSDSADIKMTTHGDNLIEHDLPRKIAKKV
jgi:hypothetical protein